MKYTEKYEVDKENLVEDLLLKKGIGNPYDYLHITKEYENDPELLDYINDGCRLLLKHLDKGSKIFIQLDSDMDGYMSSAIFYNYVKDIYPNAELSWQVHEGKQHGIIMDNIKDDIGLVIIPDAGTNNAEEQKALREMGIDVLVIDHHLSSRTPSEVTDAIIINNQMCNYPNKDLCGGGMVYKFCQYLDRILGVNYSYKYIDMAAISIVGDMMDLRNYENRYIVDIGLQNITNYGLQMLIEAQSFSICKRKCSFKEVGIITPTNVAWYIVPLVNALVRVGTENEKRLLFESFIDGKKIIPSTKRGHKGETETVSEQAIRNCVNARSRQNRLKEKAIGELDFKIQKNELYKNQLIFINVEDDEIFDSTLTGLIAMNFLSKYKKPTIVARMDSNGYWRGSARGSNTTEIKDLKAFFTDSKLFEYAEGHAFAFGVSIPNNNVEKLVDYANDKLKDIQFNENVYEVDLVYDAKEEFYEDILQIGQLSSIWGQGVEEPLVVIKSIKLFPEDINFCGEGNNTARITLSNGMTLMKFKDDIFKDKIENMNGGFALTVVGKVNLNEYFGRVTPQLFIDDYEIIDTKYDF